MRILKVSLTLLFLFVSAQLIAEPAFAKPLMPTSAVCKQPGAVVGTSGNDVLQGTEGNDVICGGSGNDVIIGGGGNDIIVGGPGNDKIDGGDGSDRIAGGSGNDELNGGDGNDQLWGESGIDLVAGDDNNDYISGGSGADHLYGGEGIDQLLGGLANDGLDGGPGADYLNGEQGDDTCVRDSADKRLSCHFDEQGPQLINIAFLPGSATVDATSSNLEDRLITFRFTVVDSGTGVRDLYVGFKALSQGNVADSSNSIHLSYRYDTCDSLHAAASSNAATYGLGDQMAGYCQLAGNENYGVYEGAALVSRNAKSGTWVMSAFMGTDKVGNRSFLGDSELAKKKMRVKFKQIGVTDSLPPTLGTVTMAGPGTLQTKDDATYVTLSFKDNKGPVTSIALGFLGEGDASIGQTYNLSDIGEIPKCTDTSSYFACLVTGNLVQGTVKLEVRYNVLNEVPKWFGPRKYKLWGVSLTDASGNNTQVSSSDRNWTQISFYKDFWSGNSTDDGDTSAPVIQKIEVLTKQINTSTADQVVRLRMSITDQGVGLDFNKPDIRLLLSLKNTINNSTQTINGQLISCSVVSGTGNANAGQYDMECVVPAHFPRGEFVVSEVSVVDASVRGNTLFFDETTTPEASKKYPIELRNG